VLQERKPDNEISLKVYERLAETRGVIVRFRGKEMGCLGCIRVTVGTEEENAKLLKHLPLVIMEVWAESGNGVQNRAFEEKKEEAANAVIS